LLGLCVDEGRGLLVGGVVLAGLVGGSELTA